MCAYPTNQVHFGSFNTKNWKSALKGLSSPRPATKNCEIVAGGHRKPFPAMENREIVAGGLFPVGKHRIKNHRIQID